MTRAHDGRLKNKSNSKIGARTMKKATKKEARAKRKRTKESTTKSQ